jgi:hypothetical protein
MSPAVIILLIALRGMRRHNTKVDRSLQIIEESLLLARQQVASQAETNRLLGQVIEALNRQ